MKLIVAIWLFPYVVLTCSILAANKTFAKLSFCWSWFVWFHAVPDLDFLVDLADLNEVIIWLVPHLCRPQSPVGTFVHGFLALDKVLLDFRGPSYAVWVLPERAIQKVIIVDFVACTLPDIARFALLVLGVHSGVADYFLWGGLLFFSYLFYALVPGLVGINRNLLVRHAIINFLNGLSFATGHLRIVALRDFFENVTLIVRRVSPLSYATLQRLFDILPKLEGQTSVRIHPRRAWPRI